MASVPPLGSGKRAVALATWEHLPLRIRAAVPIGDDELFELCQINRDLRIERAADGEILIMPPTGGEAGRRNAAVTAQLDRWCELDGSGVSFDSSTGFILPSSAERYERTQLGKRCMRRINTLAMPERLVKAQIGLQHHPEICS